MDEVGITVNKNAIPYDPEKPFVASGVRLGTPALTTCGMRQPEIEEVGRMIAGVVKDGASESKRAIAGRVAELTARFKPYPDVA